MSVYIPEGIKVHILKLLPVKSLMRFRCVCKWWKEFIDSPTFLLEHLAAQKHRFLVEASRDPEFVVVDPSDPLRLVDTLGRPTEDVEDEDVEDEDEQLHIIGTLHGVVCLYNAHSILLWNPSLCKFSSIRRPLDFEWAFRHRNGNSYGFWIDPCTKEFKIILLCLVFFEYEDVGLLEDIYGILYSSIRGNWVSIVPPPPPGELTMKWMPWEQFSAGWAVVVGSVAHWGGSYEITNDQGHLNETSVIMSYDFREERLDFVEMPNLNVLASFHPRLCLWQGTLSVLYCDTSIPRRCEMYSKQEGSWVNLFGVNLLAPIERVLCPLEGMEEWGRALVQQMDNESDAKLVVYDTKAGCVDLTRGFNYVDVAYGFVESLLLPKSTS